MQLREISSARVRAPDDRKVSSFFYHKNNVINNTGNNLRNICKVSRLWSNVLSGCSTNLTSLLSLNAISVWVMSEADLKMYFLIWSSGVCAMYKKNSKVLRKYQAIHWSAHIYTQSIVLERIKALQMVTLKKKTLWS